MLQSASDPTGVEKNAGWRDVFTVPNILSLVRILLGLCFPAFPVFCRLPVVVVGLLTDLLDGSSARYFGVCSRTGRVLDPIADKVFAAGVLGTLLWEGALSVEEVVLVSMRDLVVILGTLAALVLRRWSAFRGFEPSLLGKGTTAAQFVFFVAIIVVPEYRQPFYLVAASLSVVAGVHYLWLFLTHSRQHPT